MEENEGERGATKIPCWIWTRDIAPKLINKSQNTFVCIRPYAHAVQCNYQVYDVIV